MIKNPFRKDGHMLVIEENTMRTLITCLPQLVKQLEKQNEILERIAQAQEEKKCTNTE